MVKEGKADVGAAAIGATVKENDPEIRIIHKSRNIPGSSVYFSPKLSESDRENLKLVMMSAPAEIKNRANYGSGQEADYSFFRPIVRRTEDVLKCTDFQHNPVNLFCETSSQITTFSIVGQIKEWEHLESEVERLTLAGQDGNTYSVVLSEKLRNQVPGASSLLALKSKTIKITGIEPQKLANGIFELKITQPSQLSVFK